MILHAFRAAGWRNLQSTVVEPGPHATVFFGQNGQGKTNLVEAAHYLVEFRSFRTKTPAELVGWNSDRALLSAEVTYGGLDRRIEIEVGPGRTRGGKSVRLDDKAVRRDAARTRGLGVVVFVPDDLMLPKAAPAARRSFLDRAAFAVDRSFYGEAVTHQKVLRSRNAVLRKGGGSPALLETYDEELARAAARLVVRRRSLASALAPRVRDLFVALHAPLAADIHYRSDPRIEGAASEEELTQAVLEGLRATRTLDLRRGFTGFGPHTDDLELCLAGRPVRLSDRADAVKRRHRTRVQ